MNTANQLIQAQLVSKFWSNSRANEVAAALLHNFASMGRGKQRANSLLWAHVDLPSVPCMGPRKKSTHVFLRHVMQARRCFCIKVRIQPLGFSNFQIFNFLNFEYKILRRTCTFPIYLMVYPAPTIIFPGKLH